MKIRNHQLTGGIEKHGSSMGLNLFADLTKEEYKQRLGLQKHSKDDRKNLYKIPADATPVEALPKHWDWRDHKAVSPVMN